MSGYRNFAVAGAGNIGRFIVDELLKYKAEGKVDRVVVLTRSAEGKDAWESKGAHPLIVDYTSSSSLETALRGTDVLISTLAISALSVQSPLGSAAKAAGVQLFVPSEFGEDTVSPPPSGPDGTGPGPFAIKSAQRDHLTEIGLPWALFWTGVFADRAWFQPRLGFDIINGKVEVGGTGNGLVSWTSRSDIARYVAHTLTALTKEKLHNRVLKLEGQRISINGVLAAYQERTGKKLEVTYIPLEEVRERARDKGDVKAWLQLVWEEEGTYGAEGEMNVDWPEFGPQGVVNAILDSWP